MVGGLQIFYKEPNFDRWARFDRYPRALVRRLVRGRRRVGGQERVYINLRAGLDRLGVAYRDNDFRFAKRNPSAPVGIIGKPHVLDAMHWENPIIFGASVMSHPLAAPNLLEGYPVRRILVPGEWMRKMCEPYWGGTVRAWPVGIDTDVWAPSGDEKTTDVLLYNKVLWNSAQLERTLVEPVRSSIVEAGRSYLEFRYGNYEEGDFREVLKRCKAMVFICEHETQGIAYQQALASGVPILAWDRGGFWEDPEFYPDRVRFSPVSSVPYWDERCGYKFEGGASVAESFRAFMDAVDAGRFSPRDYILENLTLEKAAMAYVRHWSETFGEAIR